MNLSITSFNARHYLLSFFGVAMLLSVVTLWLVQPIAPQFTGNVSFDQKLMFWRDHLPALDKVSNKKIGLVVGSSMALNNVNTNILSARLDQPFFNLGVWGMEIADAHKLADQFVAREATGDVILSTQFFELRDEAMTHFRVSDEVLDQYLSGSSFLGGMSQRDFYESIKLRRSWARAYTAPHSYTNVMFNRTGAVPLDINADERDPSRWLPTQDFPQACVHCLSEVANMCRDMRVRGLGFSVVLPPLAHFVREKRPDVAALYEDRKMRLRTTLKACHASFFDAGDWADFDDSCFADFAHLNREGVREMSEMVALWRQGREASSRRRISCRLAR